MESRARSILIVRDERNEPTARTGFVDADGVQLAWSRSGQGEPSKPTLLLAHGITDSAACWDRVSSALDPSWDVVRYDARGHGLSSRADRYLVEQHTKDLVGLCAALQLDRPVVVGHSMGGVHAALAASEMDVRALILEDPHWPEIPEDGTKDIAASRRSVVRVAELPREKRLAYCRAQHPTWTESDLRPWVEAQPLVDPDVVNWFGSWRTTNRWRDHVHNLPCPGLLLTADPGTVTPSAAAEAQDLWPQLQVVKIEGAGHNIRRDRFEPYWRAVTSFLTELASGAI